MRRARGGSNAVEFALVMPVWFTVIAAVMDFSWLFYRVAVLDYAANLGCRAGSLVDPGLGDARISRVGARVEARTNEVMEVLTGRECESCTVDVETEGAPPQRSLVCTVTLDFQPLTRLVVQPRELTSVQVARLEWQRTAAN